MPRTRAPFAASAVLCPSSIAANLSAIGAAATIVVASPTNMNPETDQALASPSADTARTTTTPLATEFTGRAIVAGCIIGAILAAGNVYTGLKTAYVDGGSITAAVVAF